MVTSPLLFDFLLCLAHHGLLQLFGRHTGRDSRLGTYTLLGSSLLRSALRPAFYFRSGGLSLLTLLAPMLVHRATEFRKAASLRTRL